MALIQEVHLKMASFRPAPVIPAVQNDTNRSARMIIDDFTLQEGMTGKLSFKRSDGTYYEIDAELELQTNSFQADLAQALTQSGRTMAQLKVYDGEDVVSTYTFTIFVEEDATGQPTFQETINLRKAVEEAEEAADRAEAAAATLELDDTLTSATKAAQAKAVGDALALTGALIAPEFNISVAYDVGDYAIYRGDLYRFISSHTVGAWNSAEVVKVALAENVSGLNRTFGELENGSLDIVEGSVWMYDQTKPSTYNIAGRYRSRNMIVFRSDAVFTTDCTGVRFIAYDENLDNINTSGAYTSYSSIPPTAKYFVFYTLANEAITYANYEYFVRADREDDIDENTAEIELLESSVYLFTDADFEQGTIDTANGTKLNSDYRIRLKSIFKAQKSFTIKNSPGYTIAVFKYSDDGTFISSSGFPANDAITTYSITKGENINIVISKYPVAITTTAAYSYARIYGITRYDVADSQLTQNIDVLNSGLIETLFPESAFEQGTITSDGSNSNNNYRIRTKDVYHAVVDFSLSNKSGYTVAVFYYNDNGTFKEWSGWPDSDASLTYSIHAGDNIRIVVSKYPIALTTVSDYVGLICSTVYKMDIIRASIDDINDEIDNRYFANIAEVKDTAECAKVEKLTYYSHPYYVGDDKTYTTINAALTQWASDGYPDAVVFISNGEYNEKVFVEDHNIAFIGESKEGVILRTTTGAYSDAPMKIHHGNVYVANMTVIADHSSIENFSYDSSTIYAYAFHIDGGSVGGTVHVKNCKAVSYQCAAFGMGTIPNSKIRLENVEAYSYTASDAGQSLDYGSILLHNASTSVYPTPGTEDFEMVNVRAYAENTTNVIYFMSQTTNPLGIKAIGVILADGNDSDKNDLIHMPNYYTIDPASCGNSCNKLNY